jgi:hypothetical protein
MSERFSLDSEQVKLIGKQIVKYFLAPVLLVFLLNLKDGKDFQQTIGAVYVASLGIIINFLSKFLAND